MKILLLTFILAISLPALADPKIFGLELGATTEQSFKKDFTHNFSGVNKYSQGNMYEVPSSDIDFDGLNELTVIFDKNEKLVGVLTKFHKSKFDYLNSVLNGKYNQIRQNIPFVGNKSASYKDGQTEITLDAPHMSFTMSMNYLRKDFQTAFNRINTAENQAKQSREVSQL